MESITASSINELKSKVSDQAGQENFCIRTKNSHSDVSIVFECSCAGIIKLFTDTYIRFDDLTIT